MISLQHTGITLQSVINIKRTSAHIHPFLRAVDRRGAVCHTRTGVETPEQEYPPVSATTLTHQAPPAGRAASAPIISILCDSAQDGGAGSGERRNCEYLAARL